MDFSKFDKAFNLDDLKKDVKDAQENGANFREVPHGTYEVKIERLELTMSNTDKDGRIKDKDKLQKPMVSVWFKILEGEFKDSLIFYNQLVDEGFKINIMNEFLKSLESEVKIYFDSFSQYNNLILDVHEDIDGRLEYLLSYKKNKKGFDSYRIKEVYEL